MTSTIAVRDSHTMLRRNLKHMQRYPSVTVMLIGMPVVFLLLFVYILGGTLGSGLGPALGAGADAAVAAAGGGREAYIAYVVPGILLVTIAAFTTGTAISVAMDMTEGIIARFRTMAISRGAVLTGHVVGATIQTLIGIAVVTVVAVLIGFRATTTPLHWLAALGFLVMIALALTWLAVALGMVSKNVESASNLPMPLVLLPFLSSGFVPTESMPSGVQWIAEHQPFTPFIETIRGLLLGTPIGSSAVATTVWCAVIGVASAAWALSSYTKMSARSAVAVEAGPSRQDRLADSKRA